MPRVMVSGIGFCVNAVSWLMRRGTPVRTGLTFDEFLEFEASSIERHEFVDGNVYEMNVAAEIPSIQGETDRHSQLVLEVASALKVAARAVGYRVHLSDVLIRTPREIGYYPDVYVAQNGPGDTSREKRHPVIVVEILSRTTEPFDRGEKWQNYQTISSLEQYVLLSQDESIAEVYSRQSDGVWLYQKLIGNAVLRFPSLAVDVSLEALYQDLPSSEH
jgi:Uma2 family endonuclease